MDLQKTLQYLGISLYKKSYMLADNQAVTYKSEIPYSSLNKRHCASYHRGRETIAAILLGYYWIDEKANPADILSKHWYYQQIWSRLQLVLFYSRNTNVIVVSEQKEKKKIRGISIGKEEHSTRLSS
jgi:hypothetical protein